MKLVSILKNFRFKWVTLADFVRAMSYLIQFAFLARFMSRADIGLSAIVLGLLAIFQAFMGFGYKSNLQFDLAFKDEKFPSMYWFNFLWSSAVGLGIAILAPFVAHLYYAPALILPVQLLSVSFVLSPLIWPYKNILHKSLEREVLAKIEVSGSLTGLIVSIICILFGNGAISLVIGHIVTLLITSIIVTKNAIQVYGLPKLELNLMFLKENIFLSGIQRIERLTYALWSNLDILAVGKLAGLEALGVYSLAKQLVLRPGQVINPAVYQATLLKNREELSDKILFKKNYLKAIGYLASLNLPIYAGIFVFADELVYILFGEAWVDAIEIVKIMSLWAAVKTFIDFSPQLFTSIDEFSSAIRWNLALMLSMLVILFFGSFYNVMGIAIVMLVHVLIFIVPQWYYRKKFNEEFDLVELVSAIQRPLVICAVSMLAALFVMSLISSMLLKAISGSVVLWGLLLILNYLYNVDFLNSIDEMIYRSRQDRFKE